jgi:SAM-dependent methyltransferase
VTADREHHAVVREEFERAAEVFAKRTAGRFDHLDVLGFSRVERGASVIEVGAGTANFVSLFLPVASRVVAADLTPGMLRVARQRVPTISAVASDGARLALASGSFDLVTSAHAVHHIPDPVPVFREMARITAPHGRIMVVDLTAPDDPAQAARADEVMTIRDPSHATSRTVDAMRALLGEAELRILDHRIVERSKHVSEWMWPGEFPEDRITAVRRYVEGHWREIGMGIEPDGDDFTYLDRRQMWLAEPA